MKKCFSVLLIAAFLLAMFGCAPSSGGEEKPSPSEPGSPSEPEESLFLGKEFSVWQLAADDTVQLCYKANTTIGDEMVAHLAKLEKENDFTMNWEYHNTLYEDIYSATLSDFTTVDVAFSNSESTNYGLVDGLYLVPMHDVSDIIDLSRHDRYGSVGELESLTYKSVCYGVTPIALPGKQNFGVCSLIVFLEDVINSRNLISPREYLERNSWTWNAFRECLTNYTDPGSEVRAFNLWNFVFAESAMINNGVEYVIKGEDGQFTTGLTSPEALEALDFNRELLTDYADNILNNVYNWCDEATPLSKGESVMALAAGWTIKDEIAYQVKNYGLAPFPTGPHGTYGEWKTVVDDTEALMIPVICEDAELSANLVALLCEPPEAYSTEESILAFYNDMFFDERDTKLFVSIGRDATFSYWNVGGYNFVYGISSEISRKAPSAMVDKYVAKIVPCLEEYMYPNYDFTHGLTY